MCSQSFNCDSEVIPLTENLGSSDESLSSSDHAFKNTLDSKISRFISDSNSESKVFVAKSVRINSAKDAQYDNQGNEEVNNQIESLNANATQNELGSNSVRTTTESQSSEAVSGYQSVLGVTVHCCDTLPEHGSLLCPAVKVYVYDFLSTSSLNIMLTNCAIVDSAMTTPYDIRKRRSYKLQWEEILSVTRSIETMLKSSAQIVLLFEIIDLMTPVHLIRRKKFRPVAYGFLKIVSCNGQLNVGKRLRIQLYKVPKKYGDIVTWWNMVKKKTIASSLHITVEDIRIRLDNEDELRHYSNHPHCGSEDKPTAEIKLISKEVKTTPWKKFPHQKCKIPSAVFGSLKAGQDGCIALAFSHSGTQIAVGANNPSKSQILVYEFPSCRLLKQLSCHHGIIYEICWSSDDEIILSVSADTTAVYWYLRNDDVKVLSHPSYVYCGKICPAQDDFVITGCWDQVLRLWWKKGRDIQLLEEIDGHEGYITAVCFAAGSQMCLSGDSLGKLRIWKINLHPEKMATLECLRTSDLDGNISLLQPHISGRRVLVQTRNSRLSVFDLRAFLVTSSFTGLMNFREVVKGTLCTCGDLVFSGSEDSCIYVWNSHTGDLVAVYSSLPYSQSISTLDYHPFDHYLAVGACSDHAPVTILNYSTGSKSIVSLISPETVVGTKLATENKSTLWKSLQNKVVTKPTATSRKGDQAPDYNDKFNQLMSKLDSALLEARQKVNLQRDNQDASLHLKIDSLSIEHGRASPQDLSKPNRQLSSSLNSRYQFIDRPRDSDYIDTSTIRKSDSKPLLRPIVPKESHVTRQLAVIDKANNTMLESALIHESVGNCQEVASGKDASVDSSESQENSHQIGENHQVNDGMKSDNVSMDLNYKDEIRTEEVETTSEQVQTRQRDVAWLMDEAVREVQTSIIATRESTNDESWKLQRQNLCTDGFVEPIPVRERRSKPNNHPAASVTSGDREDEEIRRPKVIPRERRSHGEIPNRRVRGCYKFIAENDNELSFSKGELLEILNEDLATWLLAKNSSGLEGYIPANYVKMSDE